jgi:hypothetical protein
MDSIPCPDLARLDGVLNLAAHYPLNGIGPDLGQYSSFQVEVSPQAIARTEDVYRVQDQTRQQPSWVD